MKTIVLGDCAAEQIFRLADPDAPLETEFEGVTVRALACLYPAYTCIVFSGSFLHEERAYRSDLALIARDFSHWFVLEVELASHSLKGHVLPQVRALRFGDPQRDCVSILTRELKIERGQAETLVSKIPRSVAVVANKRDPAWQPALDAIGVQYVTISVFRSYTGVDAIEVEGQLQAFEESLGFGTYAATDLSLRFPSTVRLPAGEIQIFDPNGSNATWHVRREDQTAWISKVQGVPTIADGARVQLIRTFKGTISLRIPLSR